MDSEGDHATLSSHRATWVWVSRHVHIKKTTERKGLRTARLNCAFEVPMLIPHVTNDLVICLQAWAPYPSNPVARNTAMDVTIRSSRVAARRRHAVGKPGGSATFAEKEKRNDLVKAKAAAAAAEDNPVPSLSWASSL
jgi:hypothetical protein